MDFEKLGEALVIDTLEESDIYVKVKSDEEFKPVGKTDVDKAKCFLSTVNSRLNISLYDHLADVLKTILRSKIPDAVEKFEELSQQVKKVRQTVDSDLIEVFKNGDEIQAFINEKQIFYKFTSATDLAKTIKTAEEDEVDSDEDEDEDDAPEVESKESSIDQAPDLSEVLPDVQYIMSRFSQAGIGLSTEEVYELPIALKDLALQLKLQKVRFWGKVFGIKNDYYVAEAPYQDGISQENFGWEFKKEPEVVQEGEDELEEEDNEVEEEEDEKENDEETEEGEEGEEEKEKPDEVKIPPIPEPKPKDRKNVPPEPNGTGINEYVYFVCTRIGEPWRVLPAMLPSQVSEARYLKRYFTGDLESQFKGCTPYPGTEAHYLRAQIARITASTYIAPTDYYKKAGEEDEEEEEENEEEEGKESGKISLNKDFEPRSAKYLYYDGLDAWVHYRSAILYQGRCIPMKLEDKEDEEGDEKDEDENEEKDEEEEEEEPEILEAIVETEVPILRSISEDRALGRLKPWTMRLSSKLVEETAVLIMYSSLWPGAYTFYDGKSFEHIYLGYGYKYSVFHYAPPIRVAFEKEYEVGEDLLEHEDEEILPEEVVEGEDTEEGENEDEDKDDEDKDDEDKKDDENKDDEGEEEEDED